METNLPTPIWQGLCLPEGNDQPLYVRFVPFSHGIFMDS